MNCNGIKVVQLHEQWAPVATLVILIFERKHTQEESFTSEQCNPCFRYACGLWAVRAGVGIAVLLQGSTASDVSPCLHLKFHHLRTSTVKCEAWLCRAGNIKVYTSLVSAAKEDTPLEPVCQDTCCGRYPWAAAACVSAAQVPTLCPGCGVVTALQVFRGTKTLLLSSLEGGSSVTNNNYTFP